MKGCVCIGFCLFVGGGVVFCLLLCLFFFLADFVIKLPHQTLVTKLPM